MPRVAILRKLRYLAEAAETLARQYAEADLIANKLKATWAELTPQLTEDYQRDPEVVKLVERAANALIQPKGRAS
jgi:hypothetical protein